MTWSWALDGWIIVVGVLSACSCALVGNYLVLRRMSLMGDAISHAVLPGLALAFLLTDSRAPLPMFVGAVIVGLITALMTQVISRYGKVEHGAAMGVVFSVLFALGLILIRMAADHVDLDPQCVLYGNIVFSILDTVTFGEWEVPRAAIILAATLLANALFVGLFYKELKITSFDPELATTLGIPANGIHYALMVMVAATTVANFESVGSILVIAMLIVPSATAYLLSDRLGVMILLSLVLAAGSAVVGHVVALWGPGWFGVHESANTAAMMAVAAGAILLVVLIVSPEFGLAGRLARRWSLSFQIAREDILGLLYRWREMNPAEDRPLTRGQVLEAVGEGWVARLALRSLSRRREIAWQPPDQILLGSPGVSAGSHLVRSHRLWESYLAKHFNLPLDHLHAPAHRMEHYIGDDLRQELGDALTRPKLDPHGREIPASEE